MNIWLRSILRPRLALRLPQRCLTRQQARAAAFLTAEEVARALDDQIRAKYPRSSAAEVEAVVEARRGIWGGQSGGVLNHQI